MEGHAIHTPPPRRHARLARRRAAAAHADPGAGPATGFSAGFSTLRPGAASALTLNTSGRAPVAPVTLAAAIRQTVTLPKGTALRLGALPQCAAGDAELAAQGAQVACPPSTRVGAGRADGVLDGAPAGFELAVYAIRGQLFFAGERGGVPLKQGFWGTASGRRLTLVVSTFGGRIAPTHFEARLERGPAGADWLRTPRACPAARRWRFGGAFTGLTAVAGGTPVGAEQRRRATSA